MKTKIYLIGIVVFGLILLGMPPLYAQEMEPSPEEVAYQKAMQYRMADLDEIAANRDAVMDEIVATWSADANGWEEQFSINVSMADDSKLLALRNAESFDEVITILDGNTPEHLGDTDKDLVYTPVTPCKIVDTRAGGGGFIPAGSTRNYQTYGNLGGQGGSNCSSPRGEPSAVHISMVAVNPNGKGNLKAHPYGTASNRGLSINFAPIGTNLAVAGTVKVTRSDDYDISISANFSGAHVQAQVLGYYYRVEKDDFKVRFEGSRSTVNTWLTLAGGCTNHHRVEIWVPGPGKITVNAQAVLRLITHWEGTADQATVYIGNAVNSCTNGAASEGYYPTVWRTPKNHPSWSAGDEYFTLPVSRTFTVTTSGTKSYYLNAKRFHGTAIMEIDWASMQATYYPDL